jgi:site-specific DNA-methyltransferase (adenine-specific)
MDSFQTSLFNKQRVDSYKYHPLKYDTYKPVDDLTTNIQKGDLFQLGDHRLYCGDSLNTDDLDTLMRDDRADITFTSPPYNTHSKDVHIGFHHPSKVITDKQRYYNDEQSVYRDNSDDLTHEEYADFLCQSLKNSLTYSDDALFNIGLLAGSKIGITKLCYEFNEVFCDVLVWEKNTSLPLGLPSQTPMVSHRAEFIFCFNKDGTRKFTHSQWEKGTKDNIINVDTRSVNRFSKYNNATFPLSFAISIVKDFSKDSVLDIFGGMGTTLLACETLNRKCYMMEINPLYCQLIINRWEHFTGKKHTKLN